MPESELAVVTVTYDSGESVGRFVTSLSQAYSAPVEVVIADNGSTDGAPEAVAVTPGVRLLHTGGNLGYGRAANLAVHDTTSEWVLVSNPDIVFDAGALDTLLAATKRWPRGGSFGPLIHTPEGDLYPSARALPSLGRGIGHALFGWWWPANPWTAAYRRERSDPRESTAGWLSGSCLLVRRAAFDAVGGFDPGYFMYFEDVDLGERLGKAGWQNVYVPDAVVTHSGGHSTARHSDRMIAEHHHSAWLYLSRRYSGWRWLPVRVLIKLGLSARSVLARRVERVAQGAAPQRVGHRWRELS